MSEMGEEIEYRPIPVKELLKEMKDLSELMIDLAYYSVLYGDVQLANEVFELERRVDTLQALLTMQAALATRSASDAEKMVTIYAIASAANKISDAAADIARMAMKRIRVPRDFALLMCSEEDFISAVRVPVSDMSLASLFKEAATVVETLVVRRGKRIYVRPDLDFKLMRDDILVVKGSFEGVQTLLNYMSSSSERWEDHDCIDTRYASVVNMLVSFRRTSKVCVDLAYVAVLTRSYDVAYKVKELEAYTDDLLNKVSESIFQEPALSSEEKLGGLWIAIASENIADAAVDMVEPLLKGLEPHPILTKVFEEAEERISVIEMDKEDEGKTLAELGYSKKGISILAVRREDDWYVLPSKTDFVVKSGDILIVKYFSELEPLIEQLERKEDRAEIIEEIQEEEWEEE